MSRRLRLDANHAEVVAALRAVGARVLELARYGVSPDIIVNFRGKLYLAEIKTERGALAPSQIALIAAGWPIYIWRSADDALRDIGAV